MSKREVRKTSVGLEYQIDLLCKEVKRLRRNLANQIGRFDGLLQTADARVVKQELVNVDGTFAELGGLVARLLSLLDEESARREEESLGKDAENVERIHRVGEDWLRAQDDDKMSVRSFPPGK